VYRQRRILDSPGEWFCDSDAKKIYVRLVDDTDARALPSDYDGVDAPAIEH
jgi:hypothetical protein